MSLIFGNNIPSILRIAISVIDIICVAYLLYFVYKLFEDTNSISIVKGFITIIVLNIIARFAELKTLESIFNYVVANFVILIAVLFQPEIRRFLTRVGQGGFTKTKWQISLEAINEIVKAVFQMSEKKMGALIIIERKVGLKQLIDESVTIDAPVKAELLLSIFHKGNILHDGAVLIIGDRIIAARIIIPNVKVEGSFKKKSKVGTRHMAGVAVTEDSDAISIIVSEETGSISLAYKGKMESDLNETTFLRRMHEALENQ